MSDDSKARTGKNMKNYDLCKQWHQTIAQSFLQVFCGQREQLSIEKKVNGE